MRRVTCLLTPLLAASALLPSLPAATAEATLRQYCTGCHSNNRATAAVNVEKLITDLAANPNAIGEAFQHWEKVAHVLSEKRMPPAKLPQPSEADRAAVVAFVQQRLEAYTKRHAGDPGRVTLRRLTSGEYAYSIRDLTGLADYKLDSDFVADEVGGEGFTSYGDVQFMQDAQMERYLKSAKRVADHAVIGAGPLGFFTDPGKMGFEMSAIHRIHEIYRANGFRTGSAEGGKPYGLEKYAKAFYAAWRYDHRAARGEAQLTLEQAAAAEGLSPRFVRHIHSVANTAEATYPTREIIQRYRALPATDAVAARKGAEDIQRFGLEWPRWLLGAGAAAEGGAGDERALVLTDESIQVEKTHRFRGFARRNRGETVAHLHFSAVSANPNSTVKGKVIWRNLEVRIRDRERKALPAQPLAKILTPESAAKLKLTTVLEGAPFEYAADADTTWSVDVITPADATFLDFSIEASIDPAQIADAVVRCTVSDSPELSRGRPVSALMGNAENAGYKVWKTNVLQFAVAMPQISHGEPTPSDRDPIPPPFNNTYNQPERDRYHVKVKYFRDDQFLVEKMLDDATRVKLDQAWADLYASFDYHDEILQFIRDKYKVEAGGKKRIGQLTPAEIAALPAEPRGYVEKLRAHYDQVMKVQQSAHPRHLSEALDFAAQAWRRPLSDAERDQLRRFYTQGRETLKLDHTAAMRALLTRVLVSPAFLYRMEAPAVAPSTEVASRPLTGFELANRLSYFLWSSPPDAELRRAAAAGELTQPTQITRQVKRMLADAKARRFATEFFGQWLGFYRFDEYRGVDATRYPEFTNEVKTAMYDEAVSFFEHVVRRERPVREMFTANYTFLNQPLAKHYGVAQKVKSPREVTLVENADQRGGVLRLGAVLTATSAPLRTSPVKRGDWVLRRILGTPTPPPPADAGSIPADDKNFGGLSLFDRLEQHKRNPTCAACHTRIDPLGFPLESFDAVGRWRDKYSDGKPVHKTATAMDGKKLDGVEGLTAYLQANEPQVLRNLSHKLLGYALGRTVLASDKPLVEKLQQMGGDASFVQLAVEIATSPQFRTRREGGASSAVPPKPSPQQVAANVR